MRNPYTRRGTSSESPNLDQDQQYQDFLNALQQGLSQTKSKTRILLKKTGFVDILGLCMIVGFIMFIGIGIGYILYSFGLK